MNLSFSEKKGAHFFVERRRRKRCPVCQFLFAFVLITLSSLVVFLLFSIFPSLMNKGDFQIISASSFDKNKSIAIDADLKINFPDDVVDALENGIPLTIAVEVQVLRERPWWRNIIIKESTQLFELRYHPLTNVHEVKNIATDERYAFDSRQDAMAVLGTIRGAHLIEKNELSKNKQYFIQMRILLDISRLPPALRQIASLSLSWRLESSWFRWEIDNKHINLSPELATEQTNLAVELKRKHKIQAPVSTHEPEQTENESPEADVVGSVDGNSLEQSSDSSIEHNSPDNITKELPE